MQEQKTEPVKEPPTLVMKEDPTPASIPSGNEQKPENQEKKNRKRNRNRKPKNAGGQGTQKDVEMKDTEMVEEKP